MQTRRLGSTNLQFTTIGIGTWAIGGGDWKFGWGSQDEREAIAAIVHGIERGINWIDTAAVYGNGRSEELVGKALREISASQRPYIATKCGRIIQPDGTVRGCLDRESVLAECDASLRRLQIDAIDLYQIHWPDPDAQIEEAWQTLVELKQAGKVREIGVSNHNVDQMTRLQAIHPIASLQPPYSLIQRKIEEAILPYCAQNRLGVIAYSPMGKGLLTGAFSKERAAALPEDDHRSRDPQFHSPLLEQNLELVERMRAVADKHGRTVAEVAIAWVLRRPEITAAIVGARRPSQIDGILGAGEWMLPAEDLP